VIEMSFEFDNKTSDTQDARDRVRIFVTGTCEGLAQLREALGQHRELELVGSAERVADAAGALTGGHLGAVLHASSGGSLPGDDIAAIREYTRAPILLLASVESSTLLEEALEADVADVLLLPQLTENVVFAIRKATHTGRRTQAGAGGARRGKIVTVFSPKGGTGKTVTTTNVAVSLAKQHGKRTLLLDLDLQFGDAAIMLGLEPEKTIHDLVTAPGELDSEKLAGYITAHTSGLDILPAPLRPEDAELVTEAKLARLLEVARESYDLIVVDTSPFFHGPMLATLDRTDELLLLCALDVPTLKNVRLSLQTLDLLSFPSDRIKVVLRKTSTKVGMSPKEVEGALERKLAFELPADGAVALAVNRGNPLVLSDPKADFSKAISAMARSLVPAAAPRQQPQQGERKRRLAFGRS
jgi:pilus assembly protein CpaE